MSDSEDDSSFVEVMYQSSSDSEWERIDSDREQEEQEGQLVVDKELVGNEVPQGENAVIPGEEGKKVKKSKRHRRNKLRKVMIENREKDQWARITPKKIKGIITPDDPVESLGITVEDASLLAFYSVFTIGQLACFDVIKHIPAGNTHCSRILDLQEQASEIATEYVTRVSDNSALWGYCYLSEVELVEVLKNGYLESDSLMFLWTPIPSEVYKNCLAIDRIVGKEKNDPSICDRYSRLIKINLMQLCEQHDGTVHVKEGNSWLPIRLTEADAWIAGGEDAWDRFEPGTDVYTTVPHGKIMVPSGQIPFECLEFDRPISQYIEEEGEMEEDQSLQYVPKRYDFTLNLQSVKNSSQPTGRHKAKRVLIQAKMDR